MQRTCPVPIQGREFFDRDNNELMYTMEDHNFIHLSTSDDTEGGTIISRRVVKTRSHWETGGLLTTRGFPWRSITMFVGKPGVGTNFTST